MKPAPTRSTEIKAVFSSDGPSAVFTIWMLQRRYATEFSSLLKTDKHLFCHTDQNTTNQGGGRIENYKLQVIECSNSTELWLNLLLGTLYSASFLTRQGQNQPQALKSCSKPLYRWQMTGNVCFVSTVNNLPTKSQIGFWSPLWNLRIMKQQFMLVWTLNITNNNNFKTQM